MMLEGKTVRLRSYDSRDNAQEILNLINTQEVLLNLTNTIPFPFTYEDEIAFLKGQSASNDRYNFAIETIADRQYIGGCGINEMDLKNSVCTVGIFLGHPYWNQGYGTDAMKLLIHFIFEQIPIRKIKLYVFSFNKRAIKSYEKCGFSEEAVLKEELFRNGEYHDRIVMSLFRENYYENI